MVYKIVRGHGLHFPRGFFSQGIDDFPVSFVEASELERSKPDFPDAVVERLKSDVLFSQCKADQDSLDLPSYAAVVADESYLPVIGIV